RVMPHNVTTWWNSTFDMLVFALKYQQVINEITGNRDMKLRKYEVQSEEWEIAEQLCSVLKVCSLSLPNRITVLTSNAHFRSLRTQHFSSPCWNKQANSLTSYGRHSPRYASRACGM
ncbi:hypothetical protein CPC08DRAFT_648339, partial [Agrocybe pediades]